MANSEIAQLAYGDLQVFLTEFGVAVRQRDTNRLLNMLCTEAEWCDGLAVVPADLPRYPLFKASPRNTNLQQLSESAIDERPYRKLALVYARYLMDVALPPDGSTGRTELTFSRPMDLLNQLYTLFKAPDGVWLTPVIQKWATLTVKAALRLDRAAHHPGHYPHANAVAQILSRLVRLATGSEATLGNTRLRATLQLANLTFRTYFFVRAQRLCQAVINNISKAEVNPRNFPMNQFVTYKYYLGRYYLFKHHMSWARTELLEAMATCTQRPSAEPNRWRIFFHLTVASLATGWLPSSSLLRRYSAFVPLFSPLIRAYRNGQVAQFMRLCDQARDLLLPSGTHYLLRERCLIIIYRNLFRNVFRLRVDTSADKVHFMTFADLAAATRFAAEDPDVDEDEIESLLASLVSQ
ncbi:hypothetical protein IWQ60_002657 [Tieghemiomyces parasiticus]|uniref:PCI domain-containing protein n=1 Tax=Tieghemiomyces parasiticus TaxID=78921 RepID=A0A9W8E0W5_9FUNG|nr:hypothetical protein IWQ60_002657 [Tieghemiomyces parasiticus]